MKSLLIRAYTATSCLGRGLKPLDAALRAGRSGLAPCRFESARLDTWVGEVEGLDDEPVAPALKVFDCRNNRLAALGLKQDGFEEAVRATISRVGRRRFGLVLGTSTSGMLETELAYRERAPEGGALPARFDYAATHNTFSVAAFLRALLDVGGPTTVISTACSSSAKVFGSAQRMIQAGLIDAALVGGVDSLCLTTLYGFHSLQLTAPGPCRPFAPDRDGISVGEAAAFALVERVGPGASSSDIGLLGVGESSDAYHLSAPHPEGLGAQLAMAEALERSRMTPDEIDYVNLHGTATPSNDRAESRAVLAAFGRPVPCSSTKGATGHTLGAAGALEAVISVLALRGGYLPGGVNTTLADPSLGLDYLTATREARPRRILSNSFGFGGTNCSLVLGELA